MSDLGDMVNKRVVAKSIWRGGTGFAAVFGIAAISILSSCVPLAIGAAGVAVGYIARDEGLGKAPPLEGGGDDYKLPAAYGDSPADYDMPVY